MTAESSLPLPPLGGLYRTRVPWGQKIEGTLILPWGQLVRSGHPGLSETALKKALGMLSREMERRKVPARLLEWSAEASDARYFDADDVLIRVVALLVTEDDLSARVERAFPGAAWETNDATGEVWVMTGLTVDADHGFVRPMTAEELTR